MMYSEIRKGLGDYQYTALVTNGRVVATSHREDPAALTGYTEKEFEIDPNLWLRMVYEGDRYRVIHHFYELLSGKKVQQIEYRITRKDGKIRWVRDTSILQYDPDGVLTSFEGVISDITDSRKIEEVLCESDELFHSIFEKHDSVMLLIEPETGEIIDANCAAERFYRISRDDLCKLSIDNINTLSPEQVAAERDPAIREKRNFFTFEHRLSTGENRMVEVHSSPVEMGGKKILFSIIHDITEKRQTEEALKESDRYHRCLIEASIDPFVAISTDGVLTDVNLATEKITGYSREYLIGKDIAEFFTIPDVLRSEYSSILKKGQIHNYPLEIRHRDGHITPVLFNASLFYGRDGDPQGVFASSRDITEQKKADEARREAMQKLRLLTSLTRHDIFNQLSVIQSLHEIALKSTDPDIIQSYLSQAREACAQIEATIGFTREYERFGIVSSGWQRIHKIIRSAKSEINAGSVMVSVHVPDNLEVYADPIIRKVFSTLMDNAIRHGGRVTTIKFFCTEKGDLLVISCADDGIGIPQSEKTLIFDHGYGKNTGIGLFLAWEILSITGLSIMERGIHGKGALFDILIPTGKYRFVE